MDIVSKVNAFLAKFVGPNAAHAIDGLIAVALVAVPAGVGALIYSAPARLFLLHHATLGAVVASVVGVGVPVVTALAAKFRKAAGSSQPLVDDLVAGVLGAIGGHKAAVLGEAVQIQPLTTPLLSVANVSHLIQTPADIPKVTAAVVAANAAITEGAAK